LAFGVNRSINTGLYLFTMVSILCLDRLDWTDGFVEQCSAAIHHLITNAVFNISSDLMMLSIPLPLLIRSQLPPLKLAFQSLPHSLHILIGNIEKRSSAVSSASASLL
jgi:hypothetical protein